MAGQLATARTDIQADPQAVWSAMTEPAKVAQWMMGSSVDTDWQVGSPITWSGEIDGKAYHDKGEVLEADPGRVLEVTHYSPLMGQDDRPESYHRVRYELTGGDGTTTVALTQDGCEDAEQAQQFSRNWQGMLEGLKRVAESG
jgi:uncharacterized protein YndB with AHSA1/START domain